MAASALVLLTLAGALAPAELDRAAIAFGAARPGATLVRASNGGLTHASGFAAPRRAADDAENARLFLAAEGRAFGVAAGADLRALRVAAAPGVGGTALFQRTEGGLPVFGGEVAVGWRADGAVTLVNGSRALAAAPRGAFSARPDAAEAARSAALAAAPGVPGTSSVEQGWYQFEGTLLPVYRVEHDATEPFDHFVSYVDGAGLGLLHRTSRRRATLPCPATCTGPAPCICAWRGSPLAPPTSNPQGNAPETFRLQGLAAGAVALDGERASVFDCQGQDASASPAACTARTSAPGPDGSYLASPDPTQRGVAADPFAGQSAYFHIDDHSRFLDGLSPTFAARSLQQGGIGKITGYVNVLAGGQPFDNAFYAPTSLGPVMVYGQGTLVDLAYDAEVVYHELTHAAVDATAAFAELIDGFGVNVDPGSLNEGTADTFAFAHVADALAAAGDPIDSAACLSRYFGADVGVDCLRRADGAKTCRGNGPNDGRNPGRDGEVHDDGEIWTGFTWALLRAAHDRSLRPQVAQALFQALEASTSQPTFEGYARTVRQKLADLQPPVPQEALDFADCTIVQRDLAGCGDRAAALYSGERAQGGFFGSSGQGSANTAAGQQYFVDVPCGAASLHLQTGDHTGQGGLYMRYGQPVQFDGPGLTLPRFDWVVPSNVPEVVLDAAGCAGCFACGGTQTAFGAGRWYLLPYGQRADAIGNLDVFHLGVSVEMPGGAPLPASAVRVPYTIGSATGEPNLCTWGAGPVPLNRQPPPSTAPPTLDCAAPAAPGALPAACTTTGGGSAGGATPKSGCGCASGTDAAALGLLGLAALLLRRRASSRGPAM